MSEQSSATTNGYEIEQEREKLNFQELKAMLEEYGLSGDSPEDRLAQLKHASDESLVLFMTDLNRRLNGSEESLVHERVMKVGDKPTLSPEDRYAVFSASIDAIREAPEDTNPSRVGDMLALTVLMLHPYKDGNGRTARTIGFIYKDYFDQDNAQETFDQVALSRDEARQRGDKNIVVSYIPGLEEGKQSDPESVTEYLRSVVEQEDARYMGLGGEVIPLKKSPSTSETAA